MSGLLPIDRCWRSLVRAASLLLCAVMVFAGRGRAAGTTSGAVRTVSTDVTLHFAIADFDGDNRPDLATVQTGQTESPNVRYWIRFRLSTGSRLAIGITAPAGGLRIEPRDVNGDRAPDLIVTTSWLHTPVAVLVNDGHGGFTLNDPGAFPGIVWVAKTYFGPSDVQWKDAPVAIPSRCPPGDFDQNRCVASERSVLRLSLPVAARLAVFWSAASFFGRAPPSCIQHI